jgi:2,5-furandicarboxylate decarboxylase 1
MSRHLGKRERFWHGETMKRTSVSLRDFIKLLGKNKMLRVVQGPVDLPKIPEVVQKNEKKKKAVLFRRIKGHQGPLVSNLLGGREFLSLAFGCPPEDVVKEYVRRAKQPKKPNILSSGPCQEVVRAGEKMDVRLLPALIHHEKDAGPYITAGLAIAKDPETGIRNVSFNRIQIVGSQELLINIPQQLGVIQKKAEAMGKPLEVAVAIGNHPFEMMAACSKPPFGMDEFDLAGALRQTALDLVSCRTISLEVPASAEVILEGEIPPNVKREEGPFGDFMGYYAPMTRSHLFRLKAITHRRNFIFQAITAGSIEDVNLLSLPREADIYSSLIEKGVRVEAVSLHTMLFNCFVSIRKRFEEEGRMVISNAFESCPWLKYCVVVDHDVDIFDPGDIWWAIGTRSCPERGTVLIQDSPGFYRDPFRIHQSKLGIDATIPLGQWDEFERAKIYRGRQGSSQT